ncbi:MAG: FlgD immunoglobulin-like domain containing protein [Terriglobia bacterium]|nr:FlgD immunoglobulin-like domain containing protein [Terriglobia bacterium]
MQGGRIDAIAVDPRDPDIFYIGAATGGVWKTTNGGTTFSPMFDDLPALTVGDIVVAPSNPSIVWVGSGEPNNRQSSSWGTGVYKSTDGGHTWSHMGLEDTQSIGRVAIDPTNPDVVYVAALGHLWGPNAERGLFKTVDGGKTWTKVLFIDNDTGVVDVALDPGSPNIVYAAAYERRRAPWGFDGGGPGSALYKSTDGGATWKKLTEGLPKTGNLGRIGIAIYPKNPAIVYTVIEGKGGGIFRSEDRGESWKKMGESEPASPYFSQLRIDPNNDLRIWALLDFLMISSDGGKTFTPDMRTGAHWDFHDLWMDPRNSGHMLAATDGGLYRSNDDGKTWEFLNSLPLGQVYRLGFDNEKPYRLCGGFQDNGVLCGPSRTRSAEGIANTDWQRVLTGDGFFVQIDPSDPNILYSESQDGALSRLDLRSHEWLPIAPQPDPGEPPYRFSWDSPLLVSKQEPGTIYFAANYLFRSTDRGNTWTKLSGDLTTGVDRNTLTILGKTPSKDTVSLNYGIAYYPSISAVAQSPLDAKILWAGTQDGNVQVSRDGGHTWNNVATNIRGVPHGTWVSSVVASKTALGAAYVAFDGHRGDDFKAYIFGTTDFGRSWTNLSGSIPAGGTVHVVCEDPANPSLLFAGTEYGAYVSFDQGKQWEKLTELPDVPVHDIGIQPREHDLIMGTHGRSFYILDDIRPLEELSGKVLDSKLHVFSIRPATSWRLFISSNGYNGDIKFNAPNPPNGATISYYLDQDAKQVTVTVRDASGAVVQTMKADGKAGLHRVNWDLRYTTANKPLDLQIWAAQQGFLIYHSLPHLGMSAPLVPPGVYSVEVSADATNVIEKVTVADDPNVTINAADREAHDKLTMQAFHLYERGMDVQRSILGMEGALNSAQEHWKKYGVELPAALKISAADLQKTVEGLHAEIMGPKVRDPLHPASTPLIRRLAELLYSLESFTAAPTATEQERYTAWRRTLAELSARVQRVRQHDLPALNDKIRAAGIPYIAVPKPSGETEKKQETSLEEVDFR